MRTVAIIGCEIQTSRECDLTECILLNQKSPILYINALAVNTTRTYFPSVVVFLFAQLGMKPIQFLVVVHILSLLRLTEFRILISSPNVTENFFWKICYLTGSLVGNSMELFPPKGFALADILMNKQDQNLEWPINCLKHFWRLSCQILTPSPFT